MQESASNADIGPTRDSRDWHGELCYGCGLDNPHGLLANVPFDEERGEVRMTYRLSEWHRGAPGYSHGGVLAALLDEAQGVLCHHVGHLVMTDKLQIKYHKATPLDKEIHIRCWITAVRKRRMYTRAEIRSDGDLRATSHAVWYLLPDRMIDRMFASDMTSEEVRTMHAKLEANRKRAREIRRRLRRARDRN